MITSQEMVEKLQGVQPGTKLFVSYRAGRAPTQRAIEEARKAEDEGYNKRWFVGTFEAAWTTKKGDPVFRVYTSTRYNAQEPQAEGHYRTFNPALGTLLSLEVVQ